MRLKDYKDGLIVEICNSGDFAMTHKKWIGKLGTTRRICKSGKIEVHVAENNQLVVVPLSKIKHRPEIKGLSYENID